ITQTRCGHIGLNGYLARVKAVDSPLCTSCRAPETVEHYLLHCRRFRQERHRLRLSMGRVPLKMTTLLGDPRYRTQLLTYVRDTGRFSQYTDMGI
ncbi:hypothetical protein EV122DRAFT_211832, partial [Schizophyllum commune]